MAWFTSAANQRRFPRFEAGFPAIASIVGDSNIVSLCVLCNSICEGGMSISGLEGVTVGDLVSLELHLPVSRQPIWVDSVVRHGTDGFGLEFLSLSDDQRNLIRRYCRLQPQEKRRR